MPYIIKKVKDGYKVCKKDDKSVCFSKKPLSKERAEQQLKAILASEKSGGATPSNPELYEKVKKEVYENNPKHSAYRSMAVTKAYKNAGGTYEDFDNKSMNTKKWLGQKWSSVNDYYHNGEVVECGNTDTQKKFGEYPLCRPLAIIEKLSKKEMKKMIDEKDKLGKKPLVTEKVLGTDEFNIKNTKTGGCASCGGMEGGLKPLVAREGGKVLLKKRIVEKYFPDADTYTTFVDPFVGGGSVYLYKNKDGHKEVINDIDPDIIELFKGFQKFDEEKIAKDVNGDYTEKDFKDIQKSTPTSEYNKFLKKYLLYKLSYLGRGISFGKPRISANFRGYNDRLNDATILNTDYKNVIKKYDGKSTFFYLDPPVTGSFGAYKFSPVDMEELIKILKTIKGKFLLSLGSTKFNKELFKGFRVATITTRYVGERTQGGQTNEVKEHLIMNYGPRMEGGCDACGRRIGAGKKKKMCGGCAGMCGGIVPQFHNQLKKIDLDPKKYLNKAKELAKSTGYDPSKVSFSDDAKHKLMYESPDGNRYFGAVTYSDYIIWTWLEHIGDVEEGTADKRRAAYRARASNIKGDWKSDKYSPNNLAINILW